MWCECRVLNGCPNHHARCRAPIPISNTSRQRAVCSEPSKYCTQKHDSSKKTKKWYSYIELCFPANQNSHLSLCCTVKGSRSNGRPANRPRCCKCRHTVQAETGSGVNMSISWLMVRNVVTRFCWAKLPIYLLH